MKYDFRQDEKEAAAQVTSSTSSRPTCGNAENWKMILQWTYGEKWHILQAALTAKSAGQSIQSVARDMCVSVPTIYRVMRNRKEIEETVTSFKGGGQVTRSRKKNKLHTLNSLVLKELSGLSSGTSTLLLIKAAKEAGGRLRMMLLKEQDVNKEELARLEGFKASRPWAYKLVIELRSFSLSTENTTKNQSLLDTRNTMGQNNKERWN
jgi:hypothetical protein